MCSVVAAGCLDCPLGEAADTGAGLSDGLCGGRREPEGLCPGAHPLPRGWQTTCTLYPAALSPVTARDAQVLLDPESGPASVIPDEGTLSVLTTEERRGLAHGGDTGVGSGHPATWPQAGVPAHFARPAPYPLGAAPLPPAPAPPPTPASGQQGGPAASCAGARHPPCAVSLRLLVQ